MSALMNKLSAIRLPFWVMFMNTFSMAVGFYMMIPLLASYLLNDVMLTVTMVGLISAIRSFSQQGLSVLCGTLADKLGYKRTILIGLFIRSFGFALFGSVDSTPGLIVACFFSGLGGSLFNPASYAYYASLSTANNRITIYAIREMLSNMGFVVGPVLGALLMGFHFKYVSVAATLIFVFSFFFSLLFLPAIQSEQSRKTYTGIWPQMRTVLNNRPFRRFMIFTLISWSLVTQLYIAVPFRMNQLASDANIGLIYSCGAIVMVLLQVPLTKLGHAYLPPFSVMSLGTLLLAGGLFTTGLSGSIVGIYAGVIAFMIGQVFLQPMMNTMVSNYAGDEQVASYFGFNSFALSLGAILGNVGGGYLYDLGDALGWPALPWVCFLLFGLVNILFMLKEQGFSNHHRTQP
ncbi:MFS transporter [Paenibacillus roseipurpureus]|uniref:MFS transporter n=1 Tax=Paenibacillus roseopurpureus TaxID=2918901 RepID=A0AA96LND0_9BACL|nr:MFS transporter [Paenibacillus sp. MBLB1832]WNR44925.1 MFS transporter [Paenibacillus sp. MBLB1832]